jgi:hypothetical protein
MSMSGLTKIGQDKRKNASSEDLDKLLSTAQVSIDNTSSNRVNYKRCSWSLTQEIFEGFKSFAKNARMKTGDSYNDNDAVKAAYLCFSELTEDQRITFIDRARNK